MTVHVVGGGLAGLSAAIGCRERGYDVVVYEAAPQLGGRCRSYHLDAFGVEVDNGAHAVLANNEFTMRYLRLIGAKDRLHAFTPSFVDLPTQESWRLRLPQALWSTHDRPPGIAMGDLLAGAALILGRPFQPAPHALEMVWEPLCTSALNTPFAEADQKLLAPILRAMIGWGGLRNGLLLPETSLSLTYITPALEWLQSRGAAIHTTCPLRDVQASQTQASRLIFDQLSVDLGPDDAVIIAVPWWSPVLAKVSPGSTALPASPILNAHFNLGPVDPRFIGFCGGLSQWLWTRGGVASVTVSAADDVMGLEADALAGRIWAEIAPVLGRPVQPVPPAHIVKERRATLRHGAGVNANRPSARTTLSNVFLAGDWIDTALPCTLESAIKSGFFAARLAGRH